MIISPQLLRVAFVYYLIYQSYSPSWLFNKNYIWHLAWCACFKGFIIPWTHTNLAYPFSWYSDACFIAFLIPWVYSNLEHLLLSLRKKPEENQSYSEFPAPPLYSMNYNVWGNYNQQELLKDLEHDKNGLEDDIEELKMRVSNLEALLDELSR